MQSTSVTLCPWHISFYPIPFPRLLPSHNLHLLTGRKFTTSTFSTVKTQIHFTSSCSFAIAATNSRSKDQRIKKKKKKKKTVSYPNQNRALSDELYAPIDSRSASSATTQIQELRRKEPVRDTEAEVKKGYVILTNMLWADLKAALGQRINLEGIVCSVGVFTRDRHLAIPHVPVPDIRYIDWAELKRRGFRGVVFDKDNTITVPYSLTLWAPLESSLERCKSEFGNNIAVFSNSAGLYEFDPDGRKARLLETAIGIKVVRHRVKKPGGTAEEIERQFDCESSRLIMVGDRPFTDIVYGNRNGFLTILTQPLSLAEEPFIVKQVRKLEVAIINRWCRKGLKPANHGLLPDAQGCLNNYPIPPPPL